MNWTRPADLLEQLLKCWQRGELLASIVTGEATFPKRLQLKSPSSTEMMDHFAEVRSWNAELRAQPFYRVEMREFKHRVLGKNSIAAEVWIDSLDDALALLAKRKDAARFSKLIEITRAGFSPLLAWLAKRPLRALELEAEWEKLLAIVAWFKQHPRPNVYLRQIDIPGIHSKFIETHRAVLIELLDHSLPAQQIDASTTGITQFAQRYGLRDKPERIRFRLLDPALNLLSGVDLPDVTLDAASFAQLNINAARVFITENEINFLAFPPIENSLVIFGAGYGFDSLLPSQWLARCQLYYWGDIDTHGFAILDQLRSHFPQAESLLMNQETLLAFETHWGEEAKQTTRALPRLTPDEAVLYDALRDNSLRKNLRLEQERIGFDWLKKNLAKIQNIST